MKRRTKSKDAALKTSKRQTGGGRRRLKSLTELEKSIIHLIDPVACDGDPDINESFVPFRLSDNEVKLSILFKRIF